MPTVSISESDPNQTVLEGGKANFDIHVNWPQEDQVPKITVYYETVDGTGTAPTDYASSDGVVPVSIPYGQSDATIQVATTPGVDDGTDASFSVQLVNFGAMCWPEVAGGGGGGGGSSATATIVHPDVTIRLPGEASGAVTVPCDGAGSRSTWAQPLAKPSPAASRLCCRTFRDCCSGTRRAPARR